MFLTRQNQNGGRGLTKFHVEEEKGTWGYKIGYCPCGCNEQILIRTVDLRDVVDQFGMSLEAYNYLTRTFKGFEPKTSIRQKLINVLSKKSVQNF